ncbi:PREDICTED: slowpoke-binding protein isoform X1 [Trachymyrmex cornetzi]|uniref:Slowpoke-binding protein n=1 Tax=Trachymyrmex cornetzi TaxID=471704 RepID=A0A195E855_9HYME|nr:PREDICTED: slowpoke-binding protein isoform X1 [Trachymyrmex cornetzi]XP_018361828.1 PREDICTED: slowpoke-binding protein isoform X1 [Trachymyrmex cornetzi]KYN21007.1 Slowpoke-binding protein [Trachymyrmex cornetzi]
MFNLYQSLNKKDDGDGQRNRESEVTGHDRFCQHRTGHSSTRRRRRAVNRRTQSATELNARAMSTARGSLRRGRSVSTEDENESEDDKGHQLANKLDNLARLLFSRVSAARGYKDQGDVKHGRYTVLNHGSKSVSEDGVEYMEMEKRSRDRALSICRDYIGKTPRFVLIKQLNNIGSRVDKYWFMVRDTSLKTDRLLTLVPLNRSCPLTACPSTKDILNNLFLALQHPYICPVFHVDFLEYEDQTYIVLVQPINQGSLKDLIYGIERNCWNEDWIHKYAARGKGLKLPQVQRMGRQILEALVFLKERGFPTVTHLHSGNVVIQNGVARLAGLENTLLGFTSRIHPIVTSRLTHSTSIDIICFGHMLFEMCAGYELCTFRPSAVQLSDIEMYPQVVRFLELIFTESENRFTSIEELLIHDLFRNIDLREMRCAAVTVFRPTLTPSIMSLLDGIKRQDAGKGITSIDSKDSVSLNSFDGSLFTQIYNELSQTAL